ncbi:Uma2 family endonuclease [Rhodoplanes serenus]|nr:Uma2 family endonuclease [Rhodoplanes serenus]
MGTRSKSCYAPAMTVVQRQKMRVADFLAWAEGREGKWELLDGAVVGMASERLGHGTTIYRVVGALDRAIAAGCGSCHVVPNSVLVRIEEHTTFQPDALVYCGARLPDDTLVVEAPVVVVEVLSPGTAIRDLRDKLLGYFRVPSIHHYLIVDTERRIVIHHRRGDGDLIETRLSAGGPLALEPPGLTVAIEDFLGPPAE